jgi:hypothetical protein
MLTGTIPVGPPRPSRSSQSSTARPCSKERKAPVALADGVADDDEYEWAPLERRRDRNGRGGRGQAHEHQEGHPAAPPGHDRGHPRPRRPTFFVFVFRILLVVFFTSWDGTQDERGWERWTYEDLTFREAVDGPQAAGAGCSDSPFARACLVLGAASLFCRWDSAQSLRPGLPAVTAAGLPAAQPRRLTWRPIWTDSSLLFYVAF